MKPIDFGIVTPFDAERILAMHDGDARRYAFEAAGADERTRPAVMLLCALERRCELAHHFDLRIAS